MGVRAKKNNEKEIKKKNAAAKLEWRAIGRIECLLKVMGGKGSKKSSKQLMKCVKGRQISTRPLNLRYYQKPGKPRCSLRGVNAKMRTLCKKGQKKRRIRGRKKRKCPSDKVVKKCVQKMKKLKPKQKACKTLEKIGKKDLDSILELIKKWNRQKCSRRTANLAVERPNITMWTAWQITLPSS